MNLKNVTFNTVLLFGVLVTLYSCNAHTMGENKDQITVENTIGNLVSALDKQIWVIYQDEKDNYWFESKSNGVFCYNGKGLIQFRKKDGLVSNQIRGIQGDSSGNIYFSTPNGISKFDESSFTTLVPINSDKNEWKLELNDLWFHAGRNKKGVYRFDGMALYYLDFSKFNLKYPNGFNPNNTSPYSFIVYAINRDKKGYVWFGTESAGVYRYDGESMLWIWEKELSELDDGRVPGIRSIIEDKDGCFWLSNVLNRYKLKENHKLIQENRYIEYDKLKGVKPSKGQPIMKLPYFMSAVTDNMNNDLLITTYNEGLWRYDGENLTNYLINDNEKEVLMISIYKDNQGAIWLGTDNAGVYQFNGETFEKFELIKNKYN